MAAETSYFVVKYDNRAGGSFVAEGALLTWDAAASTAFIVTQIEKNATEGKLVCALYTGTIPDNNDTMTQGGVTADANGPDPTGNAEPILYPAYFREDVSLSAAGILAWTGPALGATHSFLFDGQTSNFVVGEILTFLTGQQCEVVTVVSDVGASGEVDVRWISFLDTEEFPPDDTTFTGDIAGDGTLDGLVHPRCYSPLNIHRLLADLHDDPNHAGDDVWSAYNPTPSGKDTDQITNLLGTVVMDDELAQHMTGGSVSQLGGDTLYSGLDVGITDSDGGTEPVIIQDDAIVTAYWKNAFMPNSVAGRVRILRKSRDQAVDIDGKRIRGGLFRFGDTYFTAGTTLGLASTGLALFSGADGNNETAVGTVAGAPYNTTVVTEGYQLIDHGNGNGAQPYALKYGFGSADSPQSYEYSKYIQRRGTAELLFGRNAQLFTGVTLDLAYDSESGAFSEDEELVWGTEIPYTGELSGPFSVGAVLRGDTSGALGRILYLDDQGATGTMIVATEGSTPFNNTEGLTEVGGTATATSGTVVNNSAAGTARLYALDDNGVDGFFYGQQTRGVIPADNQTIYGATSLQTADADVATSLNTRTVNTQFIGTYTGTAFSPANFGISVAVADAIAADKFTDLLKAPQSPPNNQTGGVSGGEAGDYVTLVAWDGSTLDVNGFPEPDFNEMALAVALVAATSTQIDVGTGNIPINTPQIGNVRVQRNSDSEYDLIPYDSHDSDGIYEIVGTAPSAAAIANNAYRAPIDKVWGVTGVDETYSAVYSGAPNTWTVTLLRGGVNPIKPFKAGATFGATGFDAPAQRISDS